MVMKPDAGSRVQSTKKILAEEESENDARQDWVQESRRYIVG